MYMLYTQETGISYRKYWIWLFAPPYMTIEKNYDKSVIKFLPFCIKKLYHLELDKYVVYV